MKNKIIFIVSLFFIVTLITGFKSEIQYFPAPLDETVVAFYLNFAKTGIYNDHNGDNKIKFLSDIKYICNLFGQSENNADKFLEETFLNGLIKLKEVYAYYADPMSFAIILSGKTNIEKISKYIGKNNIKWNGEYASTILNIEIPGNQRLAIEITPEMIIACPENISGNIADNIFFERNKLSNKFIIFSKAVTNNAFTALEANINTKDINKILPKCLSKLEKLTFQVTSKKTNLEMFFTSPKEMSKATGTIKESLSAFESSINENERFSLNTENTGIYISASKPDIELAKTILNRTAAFFIQFFVNSEAEISAKAEI